MGTVTDVDICNKAITKVNGNRITALGQDSKEGRLCALLYEQERDALLEEHPWNFAIGRQQLAQLSTAPAFEFDYAYSLPADAIRPLYMYDSTDRFKIESGNLLTDENPVKLVYIKQVTDTSKFSPLFIDALATKLAAELAKAIPNDSKLAERLLSELQLKLKSAKIRDGQAGTVDRTFHDTFLDARRGSFSTDNLWGGKF